MSMKMLCAVLLVIGLGLCWSAFASPPVLLEWLARIILLLVGLFLCLVAGVYANRK